MQVLLIYLSYSQKLKTIKTILHTRFLSDFDHITERYPHVDFIVLQPTGRTARMMAGSPMKKPMR